MPETPRPRSARETELLAAAASGELTTDEAREYDALVAADPSLAEETAELAQVLARLDDAPDTWREVVPSAALQARVLAIPHAGADTGADAAPVARDGGRRWLPVGAAAAALLLLGGVGGAWVAGLGDAEEATADGPPGTLGAVEEIDFQQEPAGVDIDAALVAHTWGTETVMTMAGFDPGDRYELVLVGTDGTVEDSGTFLGSTVTIDCRMNAALLREDVDAVQIRDAAGAVVASSDVPDL